MKKNIVLKRTLSIITAASMFLSSNIGGSVAFAEETGDYEFDNPGEGTTLSEITDKYGEDLAFCDRVKQLGREIWCDPSVRPGHIAHVPVYAGEHLFGGGEK